MSDAFLSRISRVNMPERDLDLVGESYRTTSSVSAQSDVAARDDGTRQIHVLLEGWTCKYRLLDDGRRQILSIHLPGDVCDLDRLSNDKVGFGLLALTDCRIATIPLDAVRKLLDERPALRCYFMHLLTLENAAMAEQIISLGRRSARERAAYFLCDLLQRLQTLGSALDNSFRLPLTQVDIGDHLGLSTVHVNRTLQDLKSERLIQSGGRTYKVCNRDALERLAHFHRGSASSEREFVPPPPLSRAFADARH